MPARTLTVLVLSTALTAQGPPFVRVHDDVVRPAAVAAPVAAPTPASLVSGVSLCGTLPVAWHSQTVPGGGTLSPIAPGNPACINRAGAFAFVANVNGTSRNQGVYVVDALGLRAIATPLPVRTPRGMSPDADAAEAPTRTAVPSAPASSSPPPQSRLSSVASANTPPARPAVHQPVLRDR